MDLCEAKLTVLQKDVAMLQTLIQSKSPFKPFNICLAHVPVK